ncbi:MAG: asparagine synthase (glutamine-hydrolyzing) [Lachnospiraceae bacterium]
MNGQYIQFEGKIYNTQEVKTTLKELAIPCDDSVESMIMGLYKAFGADMVSRLDGVFAFSLLDRKRETIYLFRDRVGVRTLYYTMVNGMLVYSSRLDKILAYPGVKAVLDQEGACELLGLGPARTPGKTPFKDIFELKPGTYVSYNGRTLQTVTYWKLSARRHEETEQETVLHARRLFEDAMEKQGSEADAGVLLSGGLDSSYVAAVHKRQCERGQKPLYTYSLDFPESRTYFAADEFQPELDRPYVDLMVKFLGSDHSYIWCALEEQLDGLIPAMRAHCLPCMADIQTTFDYFCREVGKERKILLTGECADEIFGGYPWFHMPELLNKDAFPWSPELSPRQMLLREDVKRKLRLEEYVDRKYQESLAGIDCPDWENEAEHRLRQKAYLTIQYFMQTLIRRTDIAAAGAGVDARVPFADYKLVEYAYNIPWSLKKKGGVRKYILRKMAANELPEAVYNRPKSPYPKNYDPAYQAFLCRRWKEERAGDCPVLDLIDEKELQIFMDEKKDFTAPWFGQLMRGPQMLAYLLQMNAWLKEYNVEIRL